MSKTFSIKTLGCKLNQFESLRIVNSFLSHGWQQKSFGLETDLVIINTCTVTDKSDKKCRNYIRQGAKFSKDKGVVVTGCLVEAGRDNLKLMPEVLALIKNEQKESIYEKLQKQFNWPLFKNSFHPEEKFLLEKSRPPLKIQDGCNGKCSYCIIPKVRGKSVSRKVEEVIDDAKKILDEGVKEIVLTGITIGNYSNSNYDLAGLIEKIINLNGNFRVRVSSLEPHHLTENFLNLFASEKMCQHLHLPLQSGSDKILVKMKRPYSKAGYKKIIEKTKKNNPELALGTDIIVGFPGEEAQDFQETMDLISWAEFSYTHQFLFSPRSGTEAASLKQTATKEELKERTQKLRSHSATISMKYKQKFIGKTLISIIEKKDNTYLGIADNYLKIKLKNPERNFIFKNQLLPVEVLSLQEESLIGKVGL